MKEILTIPPNLEGRVWFYTNTGSTRLMHRHDELEVNVVVRGTARYLCANRTFELHRGMQMWLFTAQDHVLLDESSRYEMWIAVFRPQLVQQLCSDAVSQTLRIPNPPGHFCRLLPAGIMDRLVNLFEELQQVSTLNPTRFNAGLGYMLLSAWDAHLAANEIGGTNVHPAIEMAAQLIHDQEDQTLSTLTALAAQVGLSPTHLSRLFREQLGMSIVDFRNRQRIQRFLHIYGYGQRLDMATAALEAGFGSYAQFHRVFKQVMHCSPNAYRRDVLTATDRSPDENDHSV